MTQQDLLDVWKAAESVTAKSLPQGTVCMDDIDALVKRVQNDFPHVRTLLERSVAAGRSAFTTWFNQVYIGRGQYGVGSLNAGAYPDDRVGDRPILALMIRRLLSGTLTTNDYPNLNMEDQKELINLGNNSGNGAWKIVAERFEQRNPEL